MLQGVFLCAALVLGQSSSPSDDAKEAPAPEPWLLMKALQGTRAGAALEAQRLQISGWTDLSFTASSDRSSNLPLGFNHRANEFLLQQNWLRIERPVDTSSKTEPSWGFRADTILPGSDYRFTTARGLLSDQLTANKGQPNLYGIDPIQFYAEAYLPMIAQGMDIKVGRFFCQIGVEANDAPSNQLWSHSYNFIYDPFTHTGFLTTTKLSDAWSVQAGLVTGSDVFFDAAATPTFIGSVKWTEKDDRNSVLFATILGSGRFNQPQQFNNVNVFNVVYTHQFDKKFSYTLDALFGYESNVPQIGTATWLGFANYLTYRFSDKLSTTARLEFFDDAQGQRTGSRGLYSALTTGLSVQLRKDIIFRPELRYDYNGESRPFEGRHGLFTAGTDLILRW